MNIPFIRPTSSATKALVLAAALGLAACAPLSPREQRTAVGATLGGVAGSVLTGGSTVGTVGGAVLGGVIGAQSGGRDRGWRDGPRYDDRHDRYDRGGRRGHRHHDHHDRRYHDDRRDW